MRRSIAPLVGLAFAALASAAGASAGQLEDTFFKSAQGSTKTVDHSAWTGFLKAYVMPQPDGLNRVAYAAVSSADRATLKGYIARLEATDVAGLDKPEQFAFWANLYNAKTIAIVIEKYPVKSIKDISLGGGLLASLTGGPWKAKVLKVSGVELSLDDIEHAILRPYHKDARVHYAVNCASVGCPNLMTEAFTGKDLERQLDASARAYVNSARGFAVRGNAVKASSIYKWFAADFGGSEQAVLEHALKYADDPLKNKLKGIAVVKSYDYDWTLNETSK